MVKQIMHYACTAIQFLTVLQFLLTSQLCARYITAKLKNPWTLQIIFMSGMSIVLQKHNQSYTVTADRLALLVECRTTVRSSPGRTNTQGL